MLILAAVLTNAPNETDRREGVCSLVRHIVHASEIIGSRLLDAILTLFHVEIEVMFTRPRAFEQPLT